MTNLSKKDQDELDRLVRGELEKPPTLGLIGVSGVGKSSAINAMFKTRLDVSHTVACTKAFEAIPLGLDMRQGPAAGARVDLVVYDAPGLGEDVSKDSEYLDMYQEHLPECDIILWVMAARNRAIALDQQYISRLKPFQDRIVFGLSQVDLVEPRNWKVGLPIPSREQEENIREIVEDRSVRLSETLARDVEIVPFSSTHGYNLDALFTTMLQSCKDHRSWIFQGLKGFDLEDFIKIEQPGKGVKKQARSRRQRNKNSEDAPRNKEPVGAAETEGFFAWFLHLLFPNAARPEAANRMSGDGDQKVKPGSREDIDVLTDGLRSIRKERLRAIVEEDPSGKT